ncbi:MAG: hypothetical protein GXP38_14760 [Chloroflexi bacterium]|nr:hypothetical protein [Chloroflexota bacterium]
MTNGRKPTSQRVVFQPRTWQGMQHGINLVIKAVAPTLGPRPRLVAFSPQFGETEIDIYDNAGEIARRILQIRGRDADVGAMLVRDMLWRLKNQMGDGTATAAVVFGTVYNEGVHYLISGGNARRLQTHLERGMELILTTLSQQTQPIEGKENLAKLAQSICYDPELSRYLGEIFDIIGAYGRLEIRKGQTRQIEREYVEGMYWERGLMSREMIADWDQLRTEFEDATLLISDLEIKSPEELYPVLELALRNDISHLVIVAASMSESVLGFLLANKQPDRFQVIAVTTPEYGKEAQAAALQDMALLTGARAFIKAAGDTFEHVSMEDFGRARRVWADLRNFGIIGGKGKARDVRTHIQKLREAYQYIDDPIAKEALLKRIGKLMGGSATLWVGGITDREVEHRDELARRTAAAMRSALEDGVLPGAGSALLSCRSVLKEQRDAASEADARAAYEILHKAMEAPTRAIISNAGFNESDVMAELRLAGPGHIFDVLQEKIVPAATAGIYDPAGVVKAAVFTAIKTAALALTVDVLVHHAAPEQAKPLGPTTRMKL